MHNQATSLNNAPVYAAVVIRGLPGIGKTTLANCILKELHRKGVPAFQINADAVRATLNKGLGFSDEDRVENARRLGSLAFLARSNGLVPVVDFVMPTKATFDAFIDGFGSTQFQLWSLTSTPEFRTRFEDTKKIFEKLQDWWGGAVIPAEKLHTVEPYSHEDTTLIADRIVKAHGF